MSRVFLLTALGLASAFISWLYISITEEITVGPGLIFGIIIGWYFKKDRPSTAIFFSIISTAIYYAAVLFTIQTAEVVNDLAIPLFIAGSLGAYLFLMSVHYILYKLSQKFIIPSSVIGGLLGLTFLISNSMRDTTNFLILYVCWQTGIALLLGLYEYNKKRFIGRIKNALKR
ncbi:MAG: hypothetical protein QG639_576 [Patescibacteria group bacterium]|nr:hypothetical protein [Patescibacteria group bacterium]